MTTSDDFDAVVARERALRRARRHRRARHALRVHAWLFAAVNLGLVGAWATQAVVFDHQHVAWFLPVTVGWGVGLLVHLLAVTSRARSAVPPRPA